MACRSRDAAGRCGARHEPGRRTRRFTGARGRDARGQVPGGTKPAGGGICRSGVCVTRSSRADGQTGNRERSTAGQGTRKVRPVDEGPNVTVVHTGYCARTAASVHRPRTCLRPCGIVPQCNSSLSLRLPCSGRHPALPRKRLVDSSERRPKGGDFVISRRQPAKLEDEMQHAVVIAGGGPTGLMLAGELALAGVDVAIVERRASQDVIGMRAGGLHSRTIEILDQRGIADRFLAQGRLHKVVQFAGVQLDISDFPTRHNYVLGLWQSHIERILAGWVGELKVPIHRQREVTGFTQDDTGVDIELSRGDSLRAEYLVGCDGGQSLVRKVACIEFPGSEPTTSNLIAEVQLAEEPEWGIRRDAAGIHSLSKLEGEARIRVLVTEQDVGRTGEPTLRDLSEALIAVYGTDYGVHSPVVISRFTDATRQAAAYRDRRVLLAGDAAHIHPPDGGQGLQTGVQDAVNLGWKLAQVVNGTSPESLLDTYHAERHPVAARVLRTTMAHVALRRPDERTEALRDTIAELLEADEPRRGLAARMSGLDLHY